jgi:hypothetical protein
MVKSPTTTERNPRKERERKRRMETPTDLWIRACASLGRYLIFRTAHNPKLFYLFLKFWEFGGWGGGLMVKFPTRARKRQKREKK